MLAAFSWLGAKAGEKVAGFVGDAASNYVREKVTGQKDDGAILADIANDVKEISETFKRTEDALKGLVTSFERAITEDRMKSMFEDIDGKMNTLIDYIRFGSLSDVYTVATTLRLTSSDNLSYFHTTYSHFQGSAEDWLHKYRGELFDASTNIFTYYVAMTMCAESLITAIRKCIDMIGMIEYIDFSVPFDAFNQTIRMSASPDIVLNNLKSKYVDLLKYFVTWKHKYIYSTYTPFISAFLDENVTTYEVYLSPYEANAENRKRNFATATKFTAKMDAAVMSVKVNEVFGTGFCGLIDFNNASVDSGGEHMVITKVPGFSLANPKVFLSYKNDKVDAYLGKIVNAPNVASMGGKISSYRELNELNLILSNDQKNENILCSARRGTGAELLPVYHNVKSVAGEKNKEVWQHYCCFFVDHVRGSILDLLSFHSMNFPGKHLSGNMKLLYLGDKHRTGNANMYFTVMDMQHNVPIKNPGTQFHLRHARTGLLVQPDDGIGREGVTAVYSAEGEGEYYTMFQWTAVHQLLHLKSKRYLTVREPSGELIFTESPEGYTWGWDHGSPVIIGRPTASTVRYIGWINNATSPTMAERTVAAVTHTSGGSLDYDFFVFDATNTTPAGKRFYIRHIRSGLFVHPDIGDVYESNVTSIVNAPEARELRLQFEWVAGGCLRHVKSGFFLNTIVDNNAKDKITGYFDSRLVFQSSAGTAFALDDHKIKVTRVVDGVAWNGYWHPAVKDSVAFPSSPISVQWLLDKPSSHFEYEFELIDV